MIRSMFLPITGTAARSDFGRTTRALACAILTAIFAFAALGVEARARCPLDQTIKESELPKQGRDTLAMIRAGGPFPHDRDGITFQNRERILPKERRGFYKEYTVRTPGVKHRGARRIVCGGDQQAATNCFYTADHYKTFSCIAP